MSPTINDVRDYLVERARKREIICYADLYKHFGYKTGPAEDKHNPIPLHLGLLMTEGAKALKPLLPSIVVKRKKDQPNEKLVPNDKYFETLCRIRQKPLPKGIREKRALHKEELDLVFDHYAPNAHP